MVERLDGARRRDWTHLCSLPQSTSRKRLVYALKERCCTEAAYQESKQQLGMDQYQGRLYPDPGAVCGKAPNARPRYRMGGIDDAALLERLASDVDVVGATC